MAVPISVPDALADRLAAVREQRSMTVEELCAELLSAGLSSTDPLEGFIGSIHSGRGGLARRHRQMRLETTEGLAGRNP